MPPAIEASGGSAGNTIAGLASLGARAAYIGKVADDQLGKVFRHDIRAAGVSYDVPPSDGDIPTGRCLIVVTPDAQRTMSTYLGAGVDLGPEDVPEALIRSARVTYLEGYLWDPPRAKEAFLKAAVSLTPPIARCRSRFPTPSASNATGMTSATGRAPRRYSLRERSRDTVAVPGRVVR